MDTIRIDSLAHHCVVCAGRGCHPFGPGYVSWVACADCKGEATAGLYLIRVLHTPVGEVEPRLWLEWNFSSTEFRRAKRVARRLAMLVRAVARCYDPETLAVEVVFRTTSKDADIPHDTERLVLRVPCAFAE